ncbi:MAG: GntR family transcriptional regulator [Acidobacteriaceae bacterium]|nr:GntR family transcriptional regulator [Acidobacteriaceae bacterium]
MPRASKDQGSGTLAERAYRLVKQAILRGEFPEGAFLHEAEILSRYSIGRTPFREACNRLHNEQLLEVVPRRGYYVPEPSFRTVRDLLETRIVLEGIAAELAALRADAGNIEELERCYRAALQTAKVRKNLDGLIEANRSFHLQIARMTKNRELEAILRGVLERCTRLVYLAASSSTEIPRDIETLLKPIVEAIRRRDTRAAHDAVVADITGGQLRILGTDVWGDGAGVSRKTLPMEKGRSGK